HVAGVVAAEGVDLALVDRLAVGHPREHVERRLREPGLARPAEELLAQTAKLRPQRQNVAAVFRLNAAGPPLALVTADDRFDAAWPASSVPGDRSPLGVIRTV